MVGVAETCPKRLEDNLASLPWLICEFDRRTSFVAQQLLYALMLLIPISGVVAYVWHGRAFDYGLLAPDFGVASDPGVFHPAKKIHQWPQSKKIRPSWSIEPNI
jgi:cytochrome b561